MPKPTKTQRKMIKKRSVPDGWLPISALGKPISGTRFLAFKVPLKDAVCNNLAPNDRFSPAILLEKEPNLRLVIDLTNTSRYYDKNEFIQNGVQYHKIFCPGREIPPQHLMKIFFRVVDNFMQSNDTEDKFIGVHCTHGINRTGYFICKYMIQKLGFTPEQAINAFQEARGHDMVREYLVDEIKKSDTIPENPEIPNPSGSMSQSRKRKHPAPSFQKSSKKSFQKNQDPFYRNHPQSRPNNSYGDHPRPNNSYGDHPRPNNSYGNRRPQNHPLLETPREPYGMQSQLNYYEDYGQERSQKNQNWRQNNRYTWRRGDNKKKK